MIKRAVIYQSSYGSTKKYAQWIAEELDADLMEAGQVKPSMLCAYDVIIYGGGLYAGGVNGISLLTKHFDSIKEKSLYLFTVGAADVTDRKNTDHIRGGLSRVLTPEMQKAIQIFHLRGGMDCPNMRFIHRLMMWLMVKSLRKKPESALENSDREMIASYGHKVDFTDRSTIAPLIEAVRACRQ